MSPLPGSWQSNSSNPQASELELCVRSQRPQNKKQVAPICGGEKQTDLATMFKKIAVYSPNPESPDAGVCPEGKTDRKSLPQPRLTNQLAFTSQASGAHTLFYDFTVLMLKPIYYHSTNLCLSLLYRKMIIIGFLGDSMGLFYALNNLQLCSKYPKRAGTNLL